MSRFLVLALLLTFAPIPVVAQSYDGTGLVPTGLLLRQLDGVKRVLMIGAHPDDEDTPLLTVLARVHGVQTAYLSLTRGDGGQNLIGSELWEGLGVIRTGELEAARDLDGGEQFFTRAFDYGYSKSAEEALAFWPHDDVLSDAVWVVRKFRPHVIVTVWSGTPRDGHGQHQASGIIAREAFEAAGDPERFPEHFQHGVAPWTPAKLYLTSRRRGGGTSGLAGFDLPAGTIDPLLGRSALQLAGLSRSQHRSQDMGSSQPMGPRDVGGFLLDSHVDGPADELFGGVDTTLVGLTAGLDADVARDVAGHLTDYRSDVASARSSLGIDPAGVVPALASALGRLDLALQSTRGMGSDELRQTLQRKRDLATRALLAAAGVVAEVRAADDLVVPGQTVDVALELWNGGPFQLRMNSVRIITGEGRDLSEPESAGGAEGGIVGPNTLASWRSQVSLRADADPSRLYFLEEERDGWMYRWPARPDEWALPRNRPDLRGSFAFSIFRDGEELGRVETTAPWRYVGVDQAVGQFEEPVLVVPRVSVQVTPGALAWPASRSQDQTVTVTVRSEAEEPVSGRVVLQAPSAPAGTSAGPPPGWSVAPESHDFELAGAGTERSFSFRVQPTDGLASGEHVFQARVNVDGGGTYTEGFSLLDYEHIERAVLYDDASMRVSVIPVEVRQGLRVGYIMGTGDDGLTAIRQMGASVELLSEGQVRSGDFSAYDALVLGVRAYEARDDVRAVNDQILDFARSGGTVVLQYNQYQFSRGGYAPYGLDLGRPAPRVSDETAEITLLEPDAPVFTTPNRITQDDFQGWVQERGLYFASEWGEEYTPLIEANDPGEPPRQGSLLVAPVGDGLYVYAALSFFRQWAASVPGAYRLFANIISLDPQEWNAFLSDHPSRSPQGRRPLRRD